MKLLFLAPFLPSHKALHGGGRLLFEMIERLSLRHQVGLISFCRGDESSDSFRSLETLCRVVRFVRKDIDHLDRRQRIGTVFSLTPSWFLHTYSQAMQESIRSVVHEYDPHIVQMEFMFMSHYAERFTHPFKILNLHEAFGRIWLRRALLHGRFAAPYFVWDYWKLSRKEGEVLRRFRRVLAFTADDKRYLQRKNPQVSVAVWRPGVAVRATPRAERGSTEGGGRILFVGSFLHPPNVDGITFFCKKVLPSVIRQQRHVRLDIVGPHAPPSVLALQGPHVTVHGYVENLDAYYEQADVAIVPIRFGTGRSTKLFEALGQGLATVATPFASEGIEVTDGEHLFVARHPRQFADRVIQLLTDTRMRQQMGERARGVIERNYGWPEAIERLEAVYEQVLSEGPRS